MILNHLNHIRQRLVRGNTTGCWAMNERGAVVGPHAPDAVSWCLVGAIHAEGMPPPSKHRVAHLVGKLLGSANLDEVWGDAVNLNDNNPPEVVIAFIDRVIELELATEGEVIL